MTKKSRQKFKYLTNKKGFYNERKNNFHHFKRAFIEANKKTFLKDERKSVISGIVINLNNHEKTLIFARF